MGKKRKTNPNKIPMTTQERIGFERSKAIKLVYCIVLYVLLDKMGMSAEEVNKIYEHCLDVSDSISKGYLNVKDIRNVLEAERNITFEWGSEK